MISITLNHKLGKFELNVLPPQNWQDFEKLIRGVIDVTWRQEGWQNYGRLGQGQSGIDLYGYDEQRRFTVIQCKKKNPTDTKGKLLTKSIITKTLIDEEVESAESLRNPKVERFIFATTSPRNTGVQDTIKSINESRRLTGKFLVEIWFWDDFQVLIERHIELMYWYYSELLEKIQNYDKNVHIMTMLRQAFTKPAFQKEIIHRKVAGILFKLSNLQWSYHNR